MARIVLFGATGYTGRLTAQALVRRGAQPLLAGRSVERLGGLASDLGGDLDVAPADASRPETVRSLLRRGDVLVSTVGPFARFGDAAAQAAIAAGAAYLDSTGEPAFIRRVFERFSGGAEAAGCGLVTAFGYDFVPGNLAGALALREAGAHAVRVDVGYFFTGSARGGASGGTTASLAGAMLEPQFAWRDGRLQAERGAARVRSLPVHGEERAAVSIGSSEHFALPRLAPGLREVNAYLGWFGPLARPLQALSAGTAALTTVPGARALLGAIGGRVLRGSSGGPDAGTRARTGSHAVAIAYDAAERKLAEVHLEGVNGYDYTARMLAWGATRALEAGLAGTGALGPAEAFGLDALEAGSADAGLARI